MAVPALPATYLVLIESALALGGLRTDLDLPAPAGDLHQVLEPGLRTPDMYHITGQFLTLIQAAPYQQVMSEATLLQCQLQPPQRHQRPVVQTLAFGPGPC